MTLSPTRDGQASARIADGIRAGILGGEYPPGTRLRQDEVAARFGASRVPVREALRILESSGLVTLVANTGAWVSKLSLAECEEIYQMRERIEPLLLRYSAPDLDPSEVDRLAALAAEMEGSTDVGAFLRLDREFHLLSYSGASTIVLGETVEKLWNATQHYRRAVTLLADDDDQRVVHDEHHMLVLAIRSGDIEGAEQVLLGHIRRTRLRLAGHKEIFQSSPAPGSP